MESRPPPRPLKRGPKLVARKSKEERDEIDRQAQQERRNRGEAAEANQAAEERKRLQRYGIDTRPPRQGNQPDKYQGNPVTYRMGRGGRGGFLGSSSSSRPRREDNGPRAVKASNESKAPEEVKEKDTPTKKPTTSGTTPTKKSAGTSSSKHKATVKEEKNTDAAYTGSSIQVREPTPDYYYISDDEEAQGGRDVDNIVEVSSDEDGLAPIRLHRERHRDRETDINLQSLSTQRRPRALSDEDISRRKGKERVTVKPDPEAVEQVDEPIPDPEEDMQLEDDVEAEAGAAEPAPEVPTDKDVNMDDTGQDESKAATAAKIRSKRVHRDPRPATAEERAEYERQQKSLNNISREFGRVTVDSESEAQAGLSDEDSAGAARPTRAGELDNATYIFQFPPILPDLSYKRVKPEPGVATSQAGPDGDTIKIEEDPELPEAPTAGHSRKPFLEPGKVGKLRIHRSGKMTLDWGGTSLAAGEGMSASFLQSVMLMKLNADENLHGGQGSNTTDGDFRAGEKHATGDGAADATGSQPPTPQTPKLEKKEWNGEVTSFGQVRGKIVVTPDWEEVMG